MYAKGIHLSEGDINTIKIYYCYTLKKQGKRDKMEAELIEFSKKELDPLNEAMVCALSMIRMASINAWRKWLGWGNLVKIRLSNILTGPH
ncbi:hypothetical protein ACFLX7_01965 [Chloroflexota bacterium]